MKIRTGFISNSSSCSFMVRGVATSMNSWEMAHREFEGLGQYEYNEKMKLFLENFFKEYWKNRTGNLPSHFMINYIFDFENRTIYFGKGFTGQDCNISLAKEADFIYMWFRETTELRKILKKLFGKNMTIKLFFGIINT